LNSCEEKANIFYKILNGMLIAWQQVTRTQTWYDITRKIYNSRQYPIGSNDKAEVPWSVYEAALIEAAGKVYNIN